MVNLAKNHVLPLFIIFTLSIVFTETVVAGEYSLADVDAAALNADYAALEKIYSQSEGRLRRVAGYRLVIAKLFILNDAEGGKRLLDELVPSIEAALELKRKDGEAWAILASLRGLQIVVQPEYSAVFGPKIGLEMALASEYGETSPTVYLLQGVNLYNTPLQYGGSKEKALVLLDRAVELYAEVEEESWGQADAYAWRGQALLATGDSERAKADFEAGLGILPNSAWLKGLLASVQ